MEISYRREMKHNYLVIETEETGSSYEVRMMADNAIEGLLKFRVKRVDDKSQYCYEITSKQPLARLLENQCLKAGEVRLLILGMAKTLSKLEEYLLKEEQILLDPNYIYVEPELFTIGFCLIPGRKSDFPAELGKLLEYLLGKVDYQDKACVVMTYGMYRESLKENYGIDDLLKFLKNSEPGEVEREDEPDAPMPEQQKVIQKVIKINQSEQINKPLDIQTTQQQPSWKERIMQKFCRLFGMDRRKTSENPMGKLPLSQDIQLPWEMVFAGDSVEPVPDGIKINDTKGNYPYEEYKEPEGPNTVLLYEKEEKPLHRLVSMEEGVPDICIAYYPFIIGKQENLVDFVMNQETVSRLHLRIDEKDGICEITDLNSTNGTGVAGKTLENNGSAIVNPGDEVMIADLRFKFR